MTEINRNLNQNIADNLNLIKKSEKSKERVLPRGFYKDIFFDVLAVFSAAGFGYTYRLYINSYLGYIIPSVVLAAFAVVSLIHSMVRKKFSRRVLAVFLEVFSALVFFYDLDIRFLFSAGLLMFIFLLWGEYAINSEFENSLHIKFFKFSKSYLSKFTTGMVLFVVIVYLPNWTAENSFISLDVFNKFFSSGAYVAKYIYPEISIDSSVEKFVESTARFYLKGNEKFNKLDQVEKNEVLKKTVDLSINNMKNDFGVRFERNELFSTVVYRYLISNLRVLEHQFGSFFIVLWTAIVFFVLRGFGAVFRLTASVFGFLLYHILISSNFIKETAEGSIRSFVEYS